jgi:mRNA interferase MazF
MNEEYPKKGDVYSVRLHPTSGKEINKTRPCLIISSNIANQSELVVIAPITSNIDRIFLK